MNRYFYGDSQSAVQASKTQLIEHAKELQDAIAKSSHNIELVAVNKLYKGHCVCRVEGRLHIYSIYGKMIRRENEFRGYGGDAWERAPNLVQLKDLEFGQMELF